MERIATGKNDFNNRAVEDLLSSLEERRDGITDDRTELETIKISVAPRSKLRVACE